MHLTETSFNLRKFMSNFRELCERIRENEQKLSTRGGHKSGPPLMIRIGKPWCDKFLAWIGTSLPTRSSLVSATSHSS